MKKTSPSTPKSAPGPTLQLRVYLAGVLLAEGEVEGPLVTMPKKGRKGDGR